MKGSVESPVEILCGKGGMPEMPKKIVIDAPKHPVVRYRIDSERVLILDLRGIRNPQSPFNGRLNPSKGSPRRFLTPEHLQAMVNEYFESCNGPVFGRNGELLKDGNGNIVKGQVRPFTVSGLALYLGVATETLRKYTKNRIDDLLDEMRVETDPEHLTYAEVVWKAKQRIEAYAEGRLYDHDGQRGAQFVLDNIYGWLGAKERAEVDKMRAEVDMKRQELELKKKLLDDEDDDSSLTINIVRGHRGDSDE